jgi:MinD-like ATPase involved in chromosome partitioning or flagellar assembly
MPTSDPSIVGVVAARPDGGTSVTCALGAGLSSGSRVLVIDLCLERPEVAALLDVDEWPVHYQLAYQSRLAPVSPDELEARVQWRDGIGVLAGSWLPPGQREEITDRFVDGLLAACTRFDHVVVDLGRPRAALPASLTNGLLVWVVTPSPLGMAALDRSVRHLAGLGCEWRTSAKVVLNRVSDSSWRGVERFIEREYGMEVAGRIPLAPRFWQVVETAHSLRALYVPMPERGRFLRAYGTDALATRQALTRLAETLLSPPATSKRKAVEV